MKLNLIYFFVYFLFIHCENEPAGIRFVLSQILIENALKWYSPTLIDYIKSIQIPDVSTTIPIGLTDLTIKISQIKYNIDNLTPNTIHVQFNDPNIIKITTDSIQAQGSFHAEIESGILFDNEDVDIVITDLTTEFELIFVKNETSGKIYPNLRFITFEILFDFDFNLIGPASQFIEIIKPVIKGLIKNTIIDQIKIIAVTEIKNLFLNLPEFINLNEKEGFAINYLLLSELLIKNNSLLYNSYGTLVNFNIPETLNPPFEIPTNLPEFDEKGKQMQIYVSDYSINSIVYTLFKSNLLNYIIEPDFVPESFPVQLDTTSLSYILSGIDEVYGKGKKCQLKLNVFQQPFLKFNENNTLLILPTEIIVNVILNDENITQAILIRTNFTFEFSFTLIEQGKISENINTLKLFATEIIESNLPKASAIVIETEFNLLTFVLTPILNNFILNNFSITFPTIEGISFNDSTLFQNEHYIAINVNLQFNYIYYIQFDNNIKPQCPNGSYIKSLILMKDSFKKNYYYKIICMY